MPLARKKQPSAASDLPAGAPFAPDLHDARHLWLKGVLLLVWVLASFVACFFARDLTLMLGGWQLGYWMAVQGAVLVFIAIVVVYCAAMSWFERQDARAAAATVATADRGHA
jgi:putative solute:sodium symporter small subunit